MIFRAGKFEYRFPRPALLMGIVNVTPDSFSDGGCFLEHARAIDHGLRLVDEGAEIIDIGGESTRPGATPVPEEEELRRVLPVIEGLRRRTDAAISVDTQKTAVARAALAAGASIVNDIAGNRPEPDMWDVVAASGAGYVLMHMKGTPQTMHLRPEYANVVAEVGEFFATRLPRLQARGVALEQIVIDPGIGFSKTAEHNFQILRALRQFEKHQRPILLGASRKSFIGKIGTVEGGDRLPGSLACAAWGILNGASILRVHDVAATRQAVRLIERIRDQE
jgi:dihydropteroate synthase